MAKGQQINGNPMRSRKIQLSDFVGTWKVDRKITDHLGVSSGDFFGTCDIVADPADPDVLYYSEKGTMDVGNGQMQAMRKYIYRAGKIKTEIDVLYEDGRPFHTINLKQTMPSDMHFCDPDAYDVTYDFRYWPKWSSRWSVRGPKKDYRMRTLYTPTTS